ncbi:MAG TPA: aldo/keto reductase, partial [Sphingomicrobium sp.]|nr:aldo/keto reductase [Sphingomicrobium sp.]
AGFLAGKPRYNYGPESYVVPADRLEERKALQEVADRHGVDLRSAAMQFSAAPDVAAALIVGAASPGQILANVTSMNTKIPADFWDELKSEGLIEWDAPVPQEALEPA